MNYNKNLYGITYPTDFIPKIKINKFNTRIVLTLKVAQTLAPTKTHTKVVLNVDCLGYHKGMNSNKMSPSNLVGM